MINCKVYIKKYAEETKGRIETFKGRFRNKIMARKMRNDEKQIMVYIIQYKDIKANEYEPLERLTDTAEHVRYP